MKQRKIRETQKTTKKVVGGENFSDSFFLSYWKMFNIPLFSRPKSDLLNIIGNNLDSGTKKYWVATVNPEFVMMAEKDEDFKQILQRTSINVIDGIGLVWARELDARYKMLDTSFFKKMIIGFRVGVEVLKGKHKEQISSGADLILDLAKMAKEKNKKIFLLGGWGNRAEKTANFLVTKNLDCRSLIVGRKNELQIDWSEGEPNVTNEEVVKKINKFKPDILLVAYGMKKQEFWIDKNLEKLDVGLVMGVGRSFDYYSGDLKRAPNWVRKMGMEWFYSLIKEPKRFKRQLALPKFVWKVLREK